MKTNGKDHHNDVAVRAERAALACLIENPKLVRSTSLTADELLLQDHRRILRVIIALEHNGEAVDLIAVTNALAGKVEPSYIGSLYDGTYIPENFKSYERAVREGRREREFLRLREEFSHATDTNERKRLLAGMQSLFETASPTDWRGIFHSFEEFEHAAPLSFAIDNFLQADGITLIGGLSGHGKTLLMLAMVRALLTSEPLFGAEMFKVARRSERVLYLIPESSIAPFWARLKLFHLEQFIRGDRLLVRTLSCREQITLEDPRILRAAQGADIFLDTAVRFMDGSENEVESTRPFAQTLFRLLAAGARSITGAHHSPKGFESAEYVSLENILRGSGDIGAMLCAAWGVRQIDPDQNCIHVTNVKARDFTPCQPFVIQGRPYLDESGAFHMLEPSGTARELKSYLDRAKERGRAGAPAMPDKAEKMRQAAEMRAQGRSLREIASTLKVSKSSVERFLFDHDSSQNSVPAGQGYGTGQAPCLMRG